MKIDEKNITGLDKIIDLQASFDKSMKILESHIAESITNKDKLESIKRDLREANEKFLLAEKYLENLKVEIENPTVKQIEKENITNANNNMIDLVNWIEKATERMNKVAKLLENK